MAASCDDACDRKPRVLSGPNVCAVLLAALRQQKRCGDARGGGVAKLKPVR